MLRYFPRRFFALFSCGFAPFVLGACAIHPVPQDVTGVSTAHIVHRNRCEAKEALLHIQDWLTHHDPAAVDELKKIGVVLSYTLDMMESDSVAAGTNFEQLVTRGTFSFNPSAGDSLKRENRRTFTIADDYGTLMKVKQCDDQPIGPNYQYPIVGTIGINEAIRTFLTMALHEDLAAMDDDSNGKTLESPGTAPAMVETLTFTTIVSAGVTPSVTLIPVGKATQLTSASLGFAWSRQDVHEVIVGLGMPPVPAREDNNTTKRVLYSSAAGSSFRARTPLLINAAVPVGTGPKSGTAVAMEAVNDQIVRFETLRQTVVVAP
jgi:hypothetical protein